jgi:hypothetical protein
MMRSAEGLVSKIDKRVEVSSKLGLSDKKDARVGMETLRMMVLVAF